MAEEKEGGGSRVIHPAEPVIILVVIAAVGGAIINRLQDFLYNNPELAGAPGSFYAKFLQTAPLLKFISVALTVLFVVLIIYLNRKISFIKQEERIKLYPPEETEADDYIVNPIINKKWVKVEEHAQSKNPNDWKIAIIEADIMLDELLDVLGYRGDSIGDKLKAVEKSDFLTLDNAWEAHKVRNAIAHKGSNFDLNDREVRRVIDLYRSVFNEFKFI